MATDKPPLSRADDVFGMHKPLFPNPVVAESRLHRLINTSHKIFMNGPSYRPRRSPGSTKATPSN